MTAAAPAKMHCAEIPDVWNGAVVCENLFWPLIFQSLTLTWIFLPPTARRAVQRVGPEWLQPAGGGQPGNETLPLRLFLSSAVIMHSTVRNQFVC